MNKNGVGMPATNEDEEFSEPGTTHFESNNQQGKKNYVLHDPIYPCM